MTDIAGTTRDTIEERVNIGGITLILIDTAGIRDSDDYVENIGIKRSKEAISNAELVILVLDASEDMTKEDEELLELTKHKEELLSVIKGFRNIIKITRYDSFKCSWKTDIALLENIISTLKLSDVDVIINIYNIVIFKSWKQRTLQMQ